MKCIHATLRNDIYGAARASTRFCREPVIDHLKLLHGLWRQFRARRTREFIVILDAIDIEAIAARAQTGEGEPAVRKGGCAARSSLDIRPSQLGSQKHKVEVIATDHRGFFDSLMVDRGRFSSLGGVNRRGLFRNSDLLLDCSGRQPDCYLNYPPDRRHDGTVHVWREARRFHAKFVLTDRKLT